jgi:regulator of sirC expression with transglutaminase-like and TPR domain
MSRARYRLSLGEAEGALEDLNLAIAQKPTLAAAYHLRGDLRAKRGELQLALDDLREFLRLAPTSSQVPNVREQVAELEAKLAAGGE